MKRPLLGILTLTLGLLGSLEKAVAQHDDKLAHWLDTNAPVASRLAAYNQIVMRGDLFPQLALRQQANAQVVSDSLVLGFNQDNLLARVRTLDMTLRLKDGRAYSRIAPAALRAPEPDIRAFAYGMADYFGDVSQPVITAVVAELKTGQSGPALTSASKLAGKHAIREAIWPLASLVTNANTGLAVMAAERLAQFPELPADVMAFMEKAASLSQTAFDAQKSRSPIILGDPTTSPAYQQERLLNALRMSLDKPKISVVNDARKAQAATPATVRSYDTSHATTAANVQTARSDAMPSRGGPHSASGAVSPLGIIGSLLALVVILVIWIRTRTH